MLLQKLTLPFFIAILCGILLIIGLRTGYISNLNHKAFIRLPSAFQASPPKNSLFGTIDEIAGGVTKYDRTSNQIVYVETNHTLLQGESLTTDSTGSAQISFADNQTIQLNNDTKISLIEATVSQLLVWQQSGNATYSVVSNAPISVRSLSLLTEIATGSASITINDTSTQVEIQVVTGQISIAYQDVDKNTHVLMLSENDHIIYNHTKRKMLPQ